MPELCELHVLPAVLEVWWQEAAGTRDARGRTTPACSTRCAGVVKDGIEMDGGQVVDVVALPDAWQVAA